MNFENPYYLFLLLFIPLYILFRYTNLAQKILKPSSFPFPWLALMKRTQTSTAQFFVVLKDILFLSLLAVLIIAMARPRGDSAVVSNNNLGLDIALLMDLSGSMLFIDNPPANVRRGYALGQEVLVDSGGDLTQNTRLAIARRVIQNYVDKQEFNRLALVLFASYALTKSPLTTDKTLLKDFIGAAEPFNEGATAIGSGILTAINRLHPSEAKSKVIILLTDGANNAGIVEPITAANVARELGIRIYTIGFGNSAGAWQPYQSTNDYVYQTVRSFDAETLQEIANITGGKYFSADDETALEGVYTEIDNLEKSEIEVRRRVLYEEKFKPWLTAGMIFLSVWLVLNFLIIKIP